MLEGRDLDVECGDEEGALTWEMTTGDGRRCDAVAQDVYHLSEQHMGSRERDTRPTA